MASKQIRPIRVEGNIAYVPLTQGYEAIIDAADVPLVEGRNWTANIFSCGVYAYYRGLRQADGKRPSVKLHRVIINAPEGAVVDHKDCNPLNNRRCNLRLATPLENRLNQRQRSDNTSGFRGVHPVCGKKPWRANIAIGGRRVTLGRFLTREEAFEAYSKASAELHGEFGRTS